MPSQPRKPYNKPGGQKSPAASKRKKMPRQPNPAIGMPPELRKIIGEFCRDAVEGDISPTKINRLSGALIRVGSHDLANEKLPKILRYANWLRQQKLESK